MKKIILSLFLVAIVQLMYAQEKLYFPLFEVINVHEDYQYGTAKLLKSYCDEEARYELILPQRYETTRTNFDKASVQAEAKNAGATSFLLADMNALGETLIISLTIYNTATGERTWGDRVKADGLSDLDPVLTQVAKLMGTQKKVSEVEDIYSVSNYDANNLRKKEADGGFMVSIGGMTTFLIDYPGVSNVFSGGFGAGYFVDSRTFLLEVGGEFKFGENINYRAMYLKGYYPFKTAALSPFLGGGFSYAAHTVENYVTESNGFGGTYDYYDSQSYSGMIISVDGGIIFNRTSSMNLMLYGSYYIGTYSMKGDTPNGFMLGLKAKF